MHSYASKETNAREHTSPPVVDRRRRLLLDLLLDGGLALRGGQGRLHAAHGVVERRVGQDLVLHEHGRHLRARRLRDGVAAALLALLDLLLAEPGHAQAHGSAALDYRGVKHLELARRGGWSPRRSKGVTRRGEGASGRDRQSSDGNTHF